MLKPLAIDSKKIFVTVLIVGYFANCLLHGQDWHFIDAADLVFHEAGHTIFRFAGQFIYICAGSFFQAFVPLVFIGYFFKQKDYFSASLMTPWLGYNLVNIAVYINDAIVMQLDLLGGDSVFHDWNYILVNSGLLSYTHTIGYAVHTAGMLLIIFSSILAFYFCTKPEKPVL